MSGLLDLGAHRAARWLALRFLEDAHAARARLDDPEDAEALHDFRVALRRLRSTVRAYADPLEDSIGGKDRRRLRALAQATGASRDGEVMIAWMEARRANLSEAEVPALDWLLDRLRRRQEELDRALLEEVAHDFGRERRRLSARLSEYTASVSANDVREHPAMGGVVADLVVGHADDLRVRLDAPAPSRTRRRCTRGESRPSGCATCWSRSRTSCRTPPGPSSASSGCRTRWARCTTRTSPGC